MKPGASQGCIFQRKIYENYCRKSNASFKMVQTLIDRIFGNIDRTAIILVPIESPESQLSIGTKFIAVR